VIDYDVYYDQGSATATYVLLEASVTTEYYLTTISLTVGEIYTFKLQARNLVGFSTDSAELSVLVARVPEAEAFVLTSAPAE
jgi:hypothetical protein